MSRLSWPPLGAPRSITVPRGILRGFVRERALARFDLEANHPQILTKGARLPPISKLKKDPDLVLTSWNLAHAVKKAELLRGPPRRELDLAVFGLLLETARLWAPRESNLRLAKGAASSLADFSGTSLAGRLGQGATILHMYDRGYRFIGRAPPATHNGRTPDFKFSGSSGGGCALVEAKGGFARDTRQLALKAKLRDASKQLLLWQAPKQELFATAALFTEAGVAAPSLVAHARIPAAKSSTGSPGPTQHWRDNYESWLRAMDWHGAAERLLDGASSGRSIIHYFRATLAGC